MREKPVLRLNCMNLSLFTLLFINASSFAAAQYPYTCMRSGNYTANSTYGSNLDAALSSLAPNMTEYGFHNASVGRGQDRAAALALCRADALIGECRTCVEDAVAELLQVCPNRRQAITWHTLCMIHYSNATEFEYETNSGWYLVFNTEETSDPGRFRADRAALLNAVRPMATSGSSLLKVAAGRRNMSDGETMYVLLQCVQSLSTEECNNCLTRAAQALPRDKVAARFLSPSCNVWYDLSVFYNEDRLRELNVSVLEMPSSLPGASIDNTRAKNDNRIKVVVSVVVSIAVCLSLAACAAIFLMKRIKKSAFLESRAGISTAESLQYDFCRISAATNDFAEANKLGQGGFGAVYWGALSSGQEIAVKRLSMDSGQGKVEFKNEVRLMARLQHRNLVRLLGFSLEGKERLLIYEFVPNASLDKFIFDPVKSSDLDWDRRYKIIGGVARGLVYLHEDSRLRIIHRDLKPGNILLDSKMNAKIADFGTARLFGQNETHRNTNRIVGTFGYMSPEYATYGQFSVKSDVFSFGMLVLEIVSGRKAIINNGENNMEDLLIFTWKNWCKGMIEDVIDPGLRAERGSIGYIMRCIHIGLLCVQENAVDRPTMSSILVMLNRSTLRLPEPLQPAFVSMSSRFGPDASVSSELGSKEFAEFRRSSKVNPGKSESRNEMSVTEL